jgi:hypothetical protein
MRTMSTVVNEKGARNKNESVDSMEKYRLRSRHGHRRAGLSSFVNQCSRGMTWPEDVQLFNSTESTNPWCLLWIGIGHPSLATSSSSSWSSPRRHGAGSCFSLFMESTVNKKTTCSDCACLCDHGLENLRHGQR